MSRQKIYADRPRLQNVVDLHLVRRTETGQMFASANWGPEIAHGYCPPIDPLVRLDMAAAQELIDELWACGLRPTEGSGSAGSLAATERHLQDMRLIALKHLGIKTKDEQ